MSGLKRKEFHILRKIAEGGFGAVYLTKLVHPDGFSRLVALKLLHRKWSKNEEIAGRMRDEARLLGWLRHRNIVDVMDLTRLDGRVAVVMEYLEAVDCGTVIKQYYEDGLKIPPRTVLEIGAFVAAALDAAFNQPPYTGEKPLRVIHRDIKPSNVMLDVHGTVKVLDFGVARADFQQREAATQEMSFGSFDYMSSERVCLEKAGPRSDVYSLGATCFELLMAERFGRVRIKKQEHNALIQERLSAAREVIVLPNGLTDAVLHLLERMLAFEEDDRPDASEVAKTMRTVARQLKEGALEEWAEDALPPIVDLFQNQSDGGKDPLVGQCLTEDPLEDEPEVVSKDLGTGPARTTLWAHEVPIRHPEEHSENIVDDDIAPQRHSVLLPVAVFGLSVLIFILGVLGLIVAILWPGVS